MSLLFLLNPKFYDVGGLIIQRLGDIDSLPRKKKKHEEVKPEPEKEPEITPESEPEHELDAYTPELQEQILLYIDLRDELAALEAQLAAMLIQAELKEVEAELAAKLKAQELEYRRKQMEIARLILLMQEEEEFMMMLLLN